MLYVQLSFWVKILYCNEYLEEKISLMFSTPFYFLNRKVKGTKNPLGWMLQKNILNKRKVVWVKPLPLERLLKASKSKLPWARWCQQEEVALGRSPDALSICQNPLLSSIPAIQHVSIQSTATKGNKIMLIRTID